MKERIHWRRYTPTGNVSKKIGFLLNKPFLKRPKDIIELVDLVVVYKTQCSVLRASEDKSSTCAYNDHKLVVINELLKNITYQNLFSSKEFLTQLKDIVNDHKKIIRKLYKI